MTYQINKTDINKSPISIPEGEIDNTSTDLTLHGRVRLEYGQQLNENILHLVEHFACPATNSTIYPSTPDLTKTIDNILENPIEGQLWYNTTNEHVYFYDGTSWYPLSMHGDYAANWGQIVHGQSLPRPISEITGHTFAYSECIWSVSPAHFGARAQYMICTTDGNGLVTMQYRPVGGCGLVNGVANYLIIGIRGNLNGGTIPAVPAPPSCP